jgi:hypothetical protein
VSSASAGRTRANETLLQRAKILADRRTGHAKLHRSFGKAAVRGDRGESSQLGKFGSAHCSVRLNTLFRL